MSATEAQFDKARIRELEQALMEIRSLAKFEQDAPTGLHMTCLSLIQSTANNALAGMDTYDMELEMERAP